MLHPSLQTWVALYKPTINAIELVLAELGAPDEVRERLVRAIDLLSMSAHPLDSIEGGRQ
jgi:hypothetical protein